LSAVSDELTAVSRPAVIVSDALQQLQRRLERAEDELAAGEVLRDNLRANREQVDHAPHRLRAGSSMRLVRLKPHGQAWTAWCKKNFRGEYLQCCRIFAKRRLDPPCRSATIFTPRLTEQTGNQ